MSLLDIGGPRRPASLRLSRERKTALLPRFRILARWRQTLSEFTAMGMAEVRETRKPDLSIFAAVLNPNLARLLHTSSSENLHQIDSGSRRPRRFRGGRAIFLGISSQCRAALIALI